jgi:protein-L-isoaspartate(D-aspartate) O-methyltransferase
MCKPKACLSATCRPKLAPAGLPNTQQLILAEKLANGRMTMKEILSVRFSQLEGTESGL